AAFNTNPDYLELSDKIAKITETLTGLKNSQKYLLRQIEEYNRRIENIPNLEQELTKLTASYNGSRANYAALQTKKMEAKLSGEFKSTSQNGYFRILDSAEVPINPIRPRMSRIIMVAIFSGLGAGVGLVFLREYMDNSLKGSTETENFLNLPVIGTIPIIKTSRDVKKARIKNFAYSFILGLYLISIGLVIAYKQSIESSGIYQIYRGVSAELMYEIEGYTP
ncbi:MAG: hypothetical protein HY920_06500, partial [Elusimicrobia bacterium]|nr:hypothetical protein [Elusimicrobiota bacterium]